jgi:hypothetical protein
MLKIKAHDSSAVTVGYVLRKLHRGPIAVE